MTIGAEKTTRRLVRRWILLLALLVFAFASCSAPSLYDAGTALAQNQTVPAAGTGDPNSVETGAQKTSHRGPPLFVIIVFSIGSWAVFNIWLMMLVQRGWMRVRTATTLSGTLLGLISGPLIAQHSVLLFCLFLALSTAFGLAAAPLVGALASPRAKTQRGRRGRILSAWLGRIARGRWLDVHTTVVAGSALAGLALGHLLQYGTILWVLIGVVAGLRTSPLIEAWIAGRQKDRTAHAHHRRGQVVLWNCGRAHCSNGRYRTFR